MKPQDMCFKLLKLIRAKLFYIADILEIKILIKARF